MLVLSRKASEEIHIGTQIVLKVLRMEGSRVQLGIVAPEHIRIRRAELLDASDTDGGGDVDSQPVARRPR